MLRLFMVSMPHSGERRASGLAKIMGSGLPFEIVDGVEAAEWRPDRLPLAPNAWPNLLVGEIGCYMAHLRAMQRIVEYRLPYACVLEDDFCFEADPDVGLAEIEATLPADFHYIHLQRDIGMNANLRAGEECGFYRRVVGTPLGAAGYVISNTLASFIWRNHPDCAMPIDHLFSQLSAHGNFYVTRKPVIGIQLGLPSDIHPKVFIDCGAHYGQAIAHFYSRGLIDESCLVYAFEPNDACRFPERAAQLPLRIMTVSAAVWVRAGRAEFRQQPDEQEGAPVGQASALHGIGFQPPEEGLATEVETIDFAEFLAGLPRDARVLCKMDIEGSEFAVLRHVLARGQAGRIQELYVEFHERMMPAESEATKAELIASLEGCGVRVHPWY